MKMEVFKGAKYEVIYRG